MLPYALQSLGGWRNETCLIPITVPGVDLSGKTVRAQVRLGPDTPGAALLDLEPTTDPTATGILVLPVTTDDSGVPTSHFIWQVTQTAMQALPYAGELGAPTMLSYALQIDRVTRLYGAFAVVASPIDSDNAPANRPLAWTSGLTPPVVGGIVLNIAQGGVTVAVNGVDLVTPLVAQAAKSAAAAKTVALDAAASRDLAQAKALVALQAATDSGAYLAAMRGLISGNQTAGVLQVQATSRAILAAIAAPTAGAQAYLGEAGRHGTFVFMTGDQSAKVTADPDQALWVAGNGKADGTAGAWRRIIVAGFASATWAGVVANLANDFAPAINRLLAMAEVTAVTLPDGIVYTQRAIMVPSGKALMGQGEGRTTVKALPNTVSGNDNAATPNNNALVYAMPGAIGVRVSDMTLDGSKVGVHYLNGINFYANRGFVAERLIIKDTSGYACWAVADTGAGGYQVDGCSGIFRDIWVFNANVMFETTAANNVLFERCHGRDGDGDIFLEAIFHPNSGSQNITYRDCTAISAKAACGGLIANYVAYELRNIVFDNVSIEITSGAAALCIASFSGTPVRGVRIVNCRIYSSTYIGAYTNGTVEVVFENNLIDGLQEGLTLNAGVNAVLRGNRLRARPAAANANNYPLLIDTSSPATTSVVLDGTILDGNGAPLATFPSHSLIRVVAQPSVVDATAINPFGIGHKVTRVIGADEPIGGASPNPLPIGVGATSWSFNGLSKGSYRVRGEGTYRAADTATSLYLSAQSYGMRRVAGRAQAEATAIDAAPLSAPMTTDGGALIANPPDVANASRGFRVEFIVIVTDDSGPGVSLVAGSGQVGNGLGGSGVTIEAGSFMTCEKVG